MRKYLSCLLVLVMVIIQVLPITAAQVVPVQPSYINGVIENVSGDSILVKSTSGDKSVVLHITDDTFVVDAKTGSTTTVKNRTNDNVIAYYGPIETRSLPPKSNAVAVILNSTEKNPGVSYAKVEAVIPSNDGVKITVNNGSLIITIAKDTPITASLTDDIVKLSDIKVGTDLLLWFNAVANSFPAQATAQKAVFLQKQRKVQDEKLKVVSKDVTSPNNMVTGTLPLFQVLADDSMLNKLNKTVNDLYDNTLKTAKAGGAKEIDFSYDVFTYKDYTSVAIYTSVSGGNTASEDVTTIIFDNKQNKIVSLKDVLGPDAYVLAEKAINKEIDNDKNAKYFKETDRFAGIKKEPSFYVDAKGNLVVIFNKYTIAPGSTGMPTFIIGSLEKNELSVADKKVSDPTRVAKGNLPLFKSSNAQTPVSQLNNKVNDIYKNTLKEAKASKAKELEFSYKVFKYKNYTSVAIYTYTSSGNTGDEKVFTIVFDDNLNKIVGIKDVIGQNAYETASKSINVAITNSTNATYFTGKDGFSKITTEPKFYIDSKGNVIVAFDKYTIAPGSAGIPTFTVGNVK